MSLDLILKRKGYNVVQTSNPDLVLALIEKNKVDLVILDFYLSDANGIDILKSIRAKENFSNIPVFMLTSEESPDIIEECLDSGATDFIIKPIIPKVLLARIRSALSNRVNIMQIEMQKKEISSSREKLSDVLYHLEKDIKKARVTQSTLIPASYIESKFYRMYSYYKPMIEVGGDFFSHFEVEDKTDILFGDVSGHGVSSAMVSCMAVLCFQIMPHDKQNVENELHFLHNTLLSYVAGHYITGVYLRFNSTKKILYYAYAGHHTIVLIRENEIIELEGKGTPLLLMKDFLTKENEISIRDGDRLFLFSDGLFEIFNPENEFYGSDEFLANVKKKVYLQGSNFLKAISDDSIHFSSNIVKDDMTMLLIEFSF
jgi:sigma-B regulation protein RsbU (phosphoserine phosphatase)